MKLSQMINNTKSDDELEQRPEGHIQSTVDDGQRSSAADVTEEELEIIKAIANPQETPAPKQEEVNSDTQAELDSIKHLIS